MANMEPELLLFFFAATLAVTVESRSLANLLDSIDLEESIYCKKRKCIAQYGVPGRTHETTTRA